MVENYGFPASELQNYMISTNLTEGEWTDRMLAQPDDSDPADVTVEQFGSFPCDTSKCSLTEIRRTVRHTGHYVWKKETSEYLIPTEVHGSKRSLHGVQQVETAATSTLAHVQQFAVASTTETTATLVVRADVE